MVVPLVPGRSEEVNRISSWTPPLAPSEGKTLNGLTETPSLAHGAILLMEVDAEGGSFDIEGTRPAEISSIERSL